MKPGRGKLGLSRDWDLKEVQRRLRRRLGTRGSAPNPGPPGNFM